jgi:hypothetical protein
MAKTPEGDTNDPTLSPQEIVHIANALNFLFHSLKNAKRLFENPAAQNGGREGAVHALEHVLKFFEILKRTELYPLILDEGLHAPLVRLYADLISLDDGNVSAMLRTKRKRGRALASGSYSALKGMVVFTVQRLESTGMDLDNARNTVAKALAKQSIRPTRGTGRVDARTLRKWQDDIGTNATATETLQEMEAEYQRRVISELGLSALPNGSTADDMLRERFPVTELRLRHLDKLARYIAMTRSQETT